jgi:hypothetical protein
MEMVIGRKDMENKYQRKKGKDYPPINLTHNISNKKEQQKIFL